MVPLPRTHCSDCFPSIRSACRYRISQTTLPNAFSSLVRNMTQATSEALVAGVTSGSVVRQSLKTAASADRAQKIGLLEFDTFNSSDVENWLELMGFPTSIMSQLSEVPVNGESLAPRAGESEDLGRHRHRYRDGAFNFDRSMVYDAPPSTSFETMFNTMINDGDTVISEFMVAM